MKECDKDYIEKRLHSHSQSIEKNVYSIIKGFDELKAEIPKVIQVTVNGKIDRLHNEVSEMRKELEIVNQKVDALKPLRMFLFTTRNLRTFLMWAAAPIAVAYALWQFIIEKFK